MSDFNQSKYQNEWNKKNMSSISVSYKSEFVKEFKESCKTLGLKQSQVFREAMEEIIRKANQQD